MGSLLKTQRFTVRLSEEDAKQLHFMSAREGFLPSTVVRHLILRFIANREAFGGDHDAYIR